MTTKYVFSLLLVSSMIMQAGPKGMPDLRAIEARKRLQEKLKAKADVSTPQGRATVARVGRSQEENAQASKEFVDRALNLVSRRKLTMVRPVSQVMREAVSSDKVQSLNDLLGGEIVTSNRELEVLAKLATSVGAAQAQ